MECPPAWNEYVVMLRDTFGLPVDKPIGNLMKLRQKGTLAEFNARFDAISTKLDLIEQYLININVAGLKDEISDLVLMFDPRSLGEARHLERIQELAIT